MKKYNNLANLVLKLLYLSKWNNTRWIEKCRYASKKIWHRLSSDDYLGSQSRNDEKLVFLHKKSFSHNFADFARRAALHIETNAVWISCLILPFFIMFDPNKWQIISQYWVDLDVICDFVLVNLGKYAGLKTHPPWCASVDVGHLYSQTRNTVAQREIQKYSE